MVKYKEAKRILGNVQLSDIDPKKYHKNLAKISPIIEKLESEVKIPVNLIFYDKSTNIPPKSAFGWRRVVDGKIVGEVQVSKDSLDIYTPIELTFKIAHEFGHLYTLPSDQSWARILFNFGKNVKLAGPLKEYVADLFVIEKLTSVLGVKKENLIKEYLNWRKKYTDADYVIAREAIRRKFNMGSEETAYEEYINKILENCPELPDKVGFIQVIKKLGEGRSVAGPAAIAAKAEEVYVDEEGRRIVELMPWARELGTYLKRVGEQKNSMELIECGESLIDLSTCRPPLLYSYAQSCIDKFGKIGEVAEFNPYIQEVLPKESLDTLGEFLVSYRKSLSRISDVYNQTHGRFNALIMRLIPEEGAGVHKPKLAIWFSDDTKMASYGLETKVKVGPSELISEEVVTTNLNQFFTYTPKAMECIFAHELTHVHEFENKASYAMWKNANNTVYKFFMSSFEDMYKYTSSLNSEFLDVCQELKSLSMGNPELIADIDKIQSDASNDILKLSKLQLKDYVGFLYHRSDSFWEYLNEKNEIDINTKISTLLQYLEILKDKIPSEKYEELSKKIAMMQSTAMSYDNYVFKKFKANSAPILRSFESFAEFFAQYYAYSYGLGEQYEKEVATRYHWIVPEVWETLKKDPEIFRTFFSGKIEDSTLFKEISKIRTDMGFVSALPAFEIPKEIAEAYVKRRIWESNSLSDRIFCVANGAAMSLAWASMLGRDSELGKHLITMSKYEDVLAKLIICYHNKSVPQEIQMSLIEEAKHFSPKYLLSSTKIPIEEREKYLSGLMSARTVPETIYYLNNILFLDREAIGENIKFTPEEMAKFNLSSISKIVEGRMRDQYFMKELNDAYSFLYSFDPSMAQKLMSEDDYLKGLGRIGNEGICGLTCVPIMQQVESK
ncbi:MAG: hypothetical protein QXP04_02355, partial [Candidatus Nanoarchaeia archaeon]|nr:hypothetical protein [Candidatus Jingweiarchaeum tengchongense]